MDAMPVLYLLDENISREVAAIGRPYGLDTVPTQEVLAKGVDDDAIPSYAAAENRCVVTANGRDFRRLSRQYEATRRTHAGIVAVPHPLPRTWSRQFMVARLCISRENPGGLAPLQRIELTEDELRPQ